MPRPKKTGPRRRHFGNLSECQIAYLRTGHDFHILEGWPADEARAAWDEHQEAIMHEHIQDAPGSRPWAWWEWEAPEPRRQIAEGPGVVGTKLSFGKPTAYEDIPPAGGMFESELEYLRRLDLLTDAENRLIARGEMIDAQT